MNKHKIIARVQRNLHNQRNAVETTTAEIAAFENLTDGEPNAVDRRILQKLHNKLARQSDALEDTERHLELLTRGDPQQLTLDTETTRKGPKAPK